jgi:hypothetical protein
MTVRAGYAFRFCTAVRLKYEDVRFADRTHDMDWTKRMQQRMNRTGAKPQSHDPNQKLLSLPAKQASLTPALAKQTNGVNENALGCPAPPAPFAGGWAATLPKAS